MTLSVLNFLLPPYHSVTLSYLINLIGSGLHGYVGDILTQGLVADRVTLLYEVASTLLIGPKAIVQAVQ